MYLFSTLNVSSCLPLHIEGRNVLVVMEIKCFGNIGLKYTPLWQESMKVRQLKACPIGK